MRIRLLVVERRQTESVFIGELAEIQVLEICQGRVKLAIRAPGAIILLRSEVVRRSEPGSRPENRGMLILSRRCGESVQIGPDAAVAVVRIRSGHVALSISALTRHRIQRSVYGEKNDSSRSSQIIAKKLQRRFSKTSAGRR